MRKILNGYQRKRVQRSFEGPSAAKQAMAAECDINNIMGRYQKTGLLQHVNHMGGTYDALPDEIDYHTAMNQVIAAQDAFASLPSSIRNRFANDPAGFLAFVQNPDNLQEMREMGLAAPEVLQTLPSKPKAANDTGETIPTAPAEGDPPAASQGQ